MQLKINTEFQELIPPLSFEELEGLEKSVKAEGCRDPLVTWQNYIIDGHHRYGICQKHNIEFKVVEKNDLETKLDVKLWMINNQFSRRNLPSIVRMDLVLQRKSLEEERALQRMHHSCLNDDPRSPVTYPLEEKGKTLEILAKQADVSYGQLFQYNKVLEKGSEEDKLAVRNKEISIKGAFQKIQKAERLETNKVTEWPKGKYRVIYADPPWSYGDERSGGSYGGATDHYNTMSLQELCDMPVADLAEKDSVLFMWVTSPMLMNEGNEVLKAWGFKYKSHFIWDKTNSFIGNYNAVQHELLLIATKGSCTPDNTQRFKSVQTITKTRKHSEKPEEFRNIIETLYTYGNKIELFSRKRVEGWEAYGNEVESISEQTIN